MAQSEKIKMTLEISKSLNTQKINTPYFASLKTFPYNLCIKQFFTRRVI